MKANYLQTQTDGLQDVGLLLAAHTGGALPRIVPLLHGLRGWHGGLLLLILLLLLVCDEHLILLLLLFLFTSARVYLKIDKIKQTM